jgi:hypothetical protein
MEINYYLLGALILFLIVLLAFFMRWNSKDKKSMVDAINQSEMEPEEHPKDSI